MKTALRLLLLPLAALRGIPPLLVLWGSGCGTVRVHYSAPPQSVLMGGVSVHFRSAHARARLLQIDLVVTNLSGQPMIVGPGGIGLRLPDGRVLPSVAGTQPPALLPPDGSLPLRVEFHDRSADLRRMPTAAVIVGGIATTDDQTPRTVGEIPLQLVGPME